MEREGGVKTYKQKFNELTDYIARGIPLNSEQYSRPISKADLIVIKISSAKCNDILNWARKNLDTDWDA
jgi:hypothetical protein